MPEIIARLRRLDSCAVADALDKLGLPPAVTGITPQTARVRIAGRVLTVRLVAGAAEAASTRHLATTAVEAAVEGDIIVIEQRTGIDAAGWGGVLSNAATLRGIAGVIVEGPARDIDEAGELRFPVYARSTTARTARGRVHELETGGPITVGTVTVATGDYALADSSGVVFVPQGDAMRVLAAAESIAAREAAMTARIRAGQPVGTVMGLSYESMLKAED